MPQIPDLGEGTPYGKVTTAAVLALGAILLWIFRGRLAFELRAQKEMQEMKDELAKRVTNADHDEAVRLLQTEVRAMEERRQAMGIEASERHSEVLSVISTNREEMSLRISETEIRLKDAMNVQTGVLKDAIHAVALAAKG